MRVHAIIITIVLHLLAFTAVAGPGHDHSHDPVTQQEVERLAMKQVERLVEKDKLDKSWQSMPVSTVEAKQFGESTEWVVAFHNRAVPDPDKRTLYVFLSMSGEYLAANFTGH
jgi:hypothetical protein